MNKKNDTVTIFCNECGFSETVNGLKYEFCPKCGHVNIGFTKVNKEEAPSYEK